MSRYESTIDVVERVSPTEWKAALSSALGSPKARRTKLDGGAVIVFSLQPSSNGLMRITPYRIGGLEALVAPDGEDAAASEVTIPYDNGPELAALVYRLRREIVARPVHSKSSFIGIRNATPEVIAATGVITGLPSHASQDGILDTLAPLLKRCPAFTGTREEPIGSLLNLATEEGTLALTSEHLDDGVRLTLWVTLQDLPFPVSRETMQVVTRNPLWMLHDNTLFHIHEAYGLLDAFLDAGVICIPPEEVQEFIDDFLAPLAERLAFRGEFRTSGELQVDPIKRLYLQETEGDLQAILRFAYGDYELSYSPTLPPWSLVRGFEGHSLVRVYRQPEVEEAAWNSMPDYGLKREEPGVCFLRRHTYLVDFLLHQLPLLRKAGYEIFGEEAITSTRINHNAPSLILSVSTRIDWFDVRASVRFGELEVSMNDLRRALRRHEHYLKLADGSIGVLPEEWLAHNRRLIGLTDEMDGGLRVSRHQITLLDQLLEEAEQTRVDRECEQRRQRLKNFSNMPKPALPEGFHGELRPYQYAGYAWLHFLHEHAFGGCLADDMGTGKTIQTLAFLQSLHENGDALSADLIVMPRSLLFNWQREAARFTPNLRVLIHADQDRDQSPEIFDQYDVVLTTYGVMLRDSALFRQYIFHYIILDESQAIKNPQSQTAKAARALCGDHRLVLTGTPVENTTMELWSQFAFLNPGLLGNLEFFRTEFALPIERQQDDRAAADLRTLVAPFLLRRTKEQIASDLPPRTERMLYCDMEPAQRKLYVRSRDYYRSLLLGLIEQQGMNKVRMKMLEGLLRLRQICNHPRLVDPSFKGSSAKFEELLTMLETLRAEGHKALVFSQFTQMLHLVRTEMDARKIPYVYLDGHTRDRSTRVDLFQNNAKIPFFLISLRAGGVGLNLTAADYVIHIDPWWNPAVEMQATDRAHRIGQEKPVIVYRLIMKDSVEEKILQLQERKRELVNQLITTDTGLLKSLSRDDVDVLFS